MQQNSQSVIGRIERYSFISAVAVAASLVAVALHPSPGLVLSTLVLALLAATAAGWQVQRLRRSMAHTHMAIGLFVRGKFDARVLNIQSLDEWGKLQHRINNLLDITDWVVRENQAAFHTGDDTAYVDKIKTSALATQMQQRLRATPVIEIPASLNISPLLKEMESLHASLAELQRSAHQTIENVKPAYVTTLPGGLAGAIRAMVEHTRQSPAAVKQLHQASETLSSVALTIERLAERGEIVALNMAISAAHVGGDTAQDSASHAVRLLANQIREAGQHIGSLVEATQTAAGGAMRVIYDLANAVHQLHQVHTQLDEQDHQASDRVGLLSQARQALAQASALEDRAAELEQQLRARAEAA